jgi:hypothetical protein
LAQRVQVPVGIALADELFIIIAVVATRVAIKIINTIEIDLSITTNQITIITELSKYVKTCLFS